MWIKVCYINISSTVLNNGFSSEWFEIKRGVSQGCPLYTIFFVLCVELLAHLIRTSKDINGLDFDGTEIKAFSLRTTQPVR